MGRNKNPANSFTEEEVRFMKQLFLYLLQGADTRVLLHCKSFGTIYKKFKTMHEKYVEKGAEGYYKKTANKTETT